MSDSGDSKSAENPFERFGLDPTEGIAGITERMRDHIHAASSEKEKAEIRDAWVALTRDPRRRLALSLGAHPETRASLGAPPPAPKHEELTLEANTVLPFVSMAACFGETGTALDTAAAWDEDRIFAPRRAQSPRTHTPRTHKPRPVTKKKE
ncbi:MAG: hypothetical protein AB8H86_05445 [Polyangiales bacterium]